jgi:tetratricopeptide (TPR) repeat protein
MAGRAGQGAWVWRLGAGCLLAGGGAVAAWWLGGQHLAWLGGAVGAASGVFAPGLVDWVRGRAEARTALANVAELPGESPAGLLDPRRGLVGFTGRDQELSDLLTWCYGSGQHGLRLVTGAGGVGKTRLSVELCARLDARRWRCVRVGDGEEQSALAVARRGWDGGVLLVVDYAETRIGLAALFRAAAVDEGVVRVLLLARSAGEWWDRLGGGEPGVRELLVAAVGESLSVTVSAGLSNEELVQAAVPAFAAALRTPVPSPVSVQAGSGDVRMLDLHAAALVAVLRSAGTGGPVTVSVADVLTELLGHEDRFWQGTAGQLGLLAGPTVPAGMPPTVLRQIVAAGALLGAASLDQAVELLGRGPDAGVSTRAARWLRNLYPPDAVGTPPGDGPSPDPAAPTQADEAEWLGSVRPDRLAELLVVTELTKYPDLARRCLTGLDQRQALRAITLLGRAAADQREAAGPLLERLLPLVEEVVAGLPAELELLTAISGAIPFPSVALAEADLAVTRRILPVLPDDDPALRAGWLGRLGSRLAQTGRPAEALPPTQEAISIRRQLAAADPDRYRPDLANSVRDLGILLSDVGRPAEALPATQEAVQIHRELAAANPERYRSDLARSLVNLGNRLNEVGRPADALPVTEEAAQGFRELAAAHPDRYRHELAAALSNLRHPALPPGPPRPGARC